MTKVTVYRDGNLYRRVVISGHALYAEYGRDVVCAGISTVVTGICNALEELTSYDTSQVILREGYCDIPQLTDDEKVQWTIDVLMVELKTVEMSYPNHIEIAYL